MRFGNWQSRRKSPLLLEWWFVEVEAARKRKESKNAANGFKTPITMSKSHKIFKMFEFDFFFISEGF